MLNLRTVHRASATLVGAYAALHIANHLLGLAGASVHLAVMAALRHVYRLPPVEFVLLLAVAVQVATGLAMFVAGLRRRRGVLAWTQAISGLALAGFLAVHVAAIFYGRNELNLDTNLYYAAAGLQAPQARAFFAPYYFTGVLALFLHVGCGLYRLRQRREAPPPAARFVGTWAAVGAVAALAIVLLLAGQVQPLDVPAAYLATFQRPQ